MSANPQPLSAAHHLITISVEGVHAIPTMIVGADIGDTFEFSTPVGELKVEFFDATKPDLPPPGFPVALSPFDVLVIRDSEVHTVTNTGRFKFRCFVKPNGAEDSEFKGWDKDISPQSGGEFPVPHNR